MAEQIDPECSRSTCCGIWVFHTGNAHRSVRMDRKFMKPGEDTKDVNKGIKNKWSWAWIEVVKNIDSSMHCNIFFPNSVLIKKVLRIDSGKQRPPTTHGPRPPLMYTPVGIGKSSVSGFFCNPPCPYQNQNIVIHRKVVF